MSADDRSADGQSADHRTTDAGSFLQRWSRRKQAVQAGVVPTETAAEGATQIAAIDPQRAAQASPSRNADPGADPSADADTKHTELPSLDSLQGLQSDYLDFMQPKVTQQLKRAALKKLFADPHFNVIDRFEAYSEDYTQADPIPAAMLRGLNQAKGLLFPHDDPKQDAPKQDESKPDAPKPDESKPDELKPDESKPDELKPDESKPDELNQERALPSAVDPLRNAAVEIEAEAQPEARPEAQLEARPAAQPLSDGLQKISIKSETYDGGRHES